MIDEAFIAEILKEGEDAKQRVSAEFSDITIEQLNWKSSPESWSIAQCLDQLVISGSAYFSTLEKITQGNYKMSFWAKHSPFTRKFGQIMKDQLQEKVVKN